MPNQVVEQEQNPAMKATNGNGRSQEFARMNGAEVKGQETDSKTLSQPTDNGQPNEPEEIVTTRPVASHPVLKGLTISGGVLIIVIVFGTMISSLTDALNSPSNQPDTRSAKTQTSKASNEKDEEGDLKTAIAITSQKGELQALVKKDNAVPAKPSPTPSVTMTPTTRAAVTVRAQPVAPRQPQVYQAPPPRPIVARATRSDQTVNSAPPRRQFTAAPAATPQPQVKLNNPRPLVARSTPKDPMQEWLAAGNVGIYSSNNDETNYDPPDIKNAQVEGGTGVKPVNASYPNQNQNTSSSIPANYGGKQVLVGTRAAGVIETPLAWVGSSNQAQQNSLIKLTQPLKGFDGGEVLPKGSYVVATISTTNSEVVQMKATSALINSSGRTLEKQLPANSILILGKDGNLLKAKSRQGGNNLGSSLMASLLSGLSKAAEIQNRANTQSTISSLGTTTTTIDNPDKNLVAGFAQGSLNEVLERMKNANEQQLRGLEQQQQVFVIEAGKQVQIFVNQSISI
ncbi:TrbI/VirB10 family protein [Nostoc sp. FACHB-110]|uniref:TrbI/VirB10 family protein n=1 Tax=Nostoc sp. FACHB-110 TaxID=2692834 RepID=UPI0016875BC0|nr:TrbI/VirB10 family protein [Nostoc sp. FACHB-110]MBD2438850.1 hypothetical protein [Nostoc sp. FACHB-110]